MNIQPIRILIATNQPMLVARFRRVLHLAGFDAEPAMLRRCGRLAELRIDASWLIVVDAKLTPALGMLAEAVRRSPQSRFVLAGSAITPEMLQIVLESGMHGVVSIDLLPEEAAETLARIWHGERQFRFDCAGTWPTARPVPMSDGFDAGWMFGEAV